MRAKKVALVTGVLGGIGSEIVKAFLEQDYAVVGLDLGDGQSVDKGYYSEKSYQLVTCDLYQYVSKPTYRGDVLAAIRQAFPPSFDYFCLVNNAAKQVLSWIRDIDTVDWNESMAINAQAPLQLSIDFRDELISSRGAIVNISSIHASQTKAKFCIYAASKAALESITRSLSLELGSSGVAVNAIAPAAIATPMLKAGFVENKEGLQQLERYHPVGQIGNPADLARFVVNLANSKDRFLSGAVISYSGAISNRLYDPA